MKILFVKHNITTDSYLHTLAESKNSLIYVFHHKKALTKVPQGVVEVSTKYQPSIIGKVFGYLKIQHMYPQYIPHFQKTLTEIKPNCIVVADFYDFIFAQAIFYKKKNPNTKIYVWSETRAWPRFWLTRWVMYCFWWYFKKNVGLVEKVFVFSEAGKNFFGRYAPEVKVEVFPAAVDTKKFFPADGKLFKPNGTLRILMNARFVALKDHRTLFKALKILQDKGVTFKLSLIGRGGHLKDELLQYAEDLGIRKNIKVFETVPLDQLRDIYVQHDILVLPSNKEAIGMVVPEAMACGLPTVTSSVVGANTYVKENETGFIFEVGNAEDLSAKIDKLNNENTLEMFSKNAFNLIQKEYSKEVLGRKMNDEFNSFNN